MEKGRSNKFKRALTHLKSTTIDEKLQLLSEVPTNSTSGIYTDDPREPITITTELNTSLDPLDLSQDGGNDGRDTSGLFMPDGTILAEEPPGDTSYILGPMAAMFYTYSYPWTMVGYIRQGDRQFVNLGRIDGKLSEWNGSVGDASENSGTFRSYGQLTAEQALWFKEAQKQPGININDASTWNYYAFYPGPPGQTPDAHGRYPCAISGQSKRRTETTQGETPGTMKGFSDDPRPYEPLERQGAPYDPFGELAILGLSAAAVLALKSAIAAAGSAAVLNKARGILRGAKNWYNQGRNVRIPNENNVSWKTLMRDGQLQRQRISADPNSAWNPFRGMPGYGSAKSVINPRIRAINARRVAQGKPRLSMDKINPGGFQTGPSPDVRQAIERPIRALMNLFQEYEYDGEFITEDVSDDIIDAVDNALKETETIGEFMDVLDIVIAKIKQRESELKKQKNEEVSPRKKLIKEIKKPYVVKEIKQEKLKGYRPRVTGGGINTEPDKLMLKSENPASFKPMDETVWTKQDKYYNARLSQERKNEILDHLGTTHHYWQILTETGRKSNEKAFQERYGDYKVVRKEQLTGDTLLLFADENGNKESMLQSEYQNMIARQIEEPLYEQEKLKEPKDTLSKRIKNKLGDYPNKPSKAGYPNEPPPKMVNGYHPEYGKRSSYYNRLDPQSAKSMPTTGDPEIDAKVASQKTSSLKPVRSVKGKPNT